jgi:hypothetical protein
MHGDSAVFAPDEVSYFTNVAVIGATLLGLTFVALSFFLLDLLRRYEHVSFPVFRDRDPVDTESLSRHIKHPHSLSDRELLDGDPLVVFIAFSVAVTWNLFMLPLAIGLTAAWGGVRFPVIAVELAIFCGVLIFSFRVRASTINRLCPYLTREELLWPVFGAIGMLVYLLGLGVVTIAALPDAVPTIQRLAVWNQYGIANDRAAIFAIKTICVLSLLVGTYTANKDMFIFFKTMAAERMRQRWLQDFIKEGYPRLEQQVARHKSKLAPNAHRHDAVIGLWNGGLPTIVSTHDAIRQGGDLFTTALWNDLHRRQGGIPVWMFDIPRIADWAAQLEDALDRYSGHAASTQTQQ